MLQGCIMLAKKAGQFTSSCVVAVGAMSTASRRAVSLLACFVIAMAPATAHAEGPGTVEHLTYDAGGTTFPYIVYTPNEYRAGKPMPLVVVAHGCQTTAEQQMQANLYNDVADREGFVVMYPDTDASADLQPGPLVKCWRFFAPSSWTRGGDHAAAIAGMTLATLDQRDIDPDRVYLIGMSAGAFMTSIMVAAYPDLYTAVGIMAGGPYASGATCTLQSVTQDAFSPDRAATLTHAEMGERARVIPIIELHGDADNSVSPQCGANALESVLRADNLTISGQQTSPIALESATTRSATAPGGKWYTVATYRDPAGCEIAERWLIHGMGHFWSGGSSDPALKAFTDPTGPSAAEGSWAFFKRFRKSQTAMPCAEADAAASSAVLPAARKCRSRRHIVIHIGSDVIVARIKVSHRRVMVLRGKSLRTRVDLRGLPRGRYTVTIVMRTRTHRVIRSRRAYRTCTPKRDSGK
jgi:poly(hydroxyalkanoate) depolymerase family esterase